MKTMKNHGAIPTRTLRPAPGRPLNATTRANAVRLPFLDPWPEPAAHDLMVLNPRSDLTPIPTPNAPLGAFLEVILS